VTKMALRYCFDRKIRASLMRLLGWLTPKSAERQVTLRRQGIRKILLVRSIFRMGDSILATPAIFLLRKNFPKARIDFVGPVITESLFQNLPIDHYYPVHRNFFKAVGSYPALLLRIRRERYDLAVDVSCSSAALGSLIVGFSGARFRAGLRGKWDRWFNCRLPRPVAKDKYENLPELISSMGLQTEHCYPRLILTSREREESKRRIEAIVGRGAQPVVGIFVGGRKTRGKRWPQERFCEVAAALRAQRAKTVIFIGPEERELTGYFQEVLKHPSAIVVEPDPRAFAAMIANCDLFVGSDSGPIHLSCALRVPTVAIFLSGNADRWGPPAELGRIVHGKDGVPAEAVLEACRLELAKISTTIAPSWVVNA
jgi:heptosyltransferase-3